jgi:hypothetical protein
LVADGSDGGSKCRVDFGSKKDYLITIVSLSTPTDPTIPESLKECLDRSERIAVMEKGDVFVECWSGTFGLECDAEGRCEPEGSSMAFKPVIKLGNANL